MATPNPWTPEVEQQLRDLNAAETSLTESARRLGRSKASVSVKAKALGLTWDRRKTRAATAAHRDDAAARRARLDLDLLGDAERLRTRLWQPLEYVDHGGKDYTEVRWTLPEPTPTDKLKLMQAAGLAIDRSLRLSEFDAGDGADTARSLLADLGRALGVTPASPAGDA